MPVTKDNKKIKSNIDHRWDLLCRVRYNNTIPDIPFKPKFINYPFDNDRYVDYANFSLQTNHKYDLITEVDLDIPIDLIDPTIYQPEDNPTLHPDDEALLYDEVTIPQKKYKY
ncbi:hypothetical protein A3Q56_00079 [Intoshia linei]|uniref:RNA polymerase II-associated factor 1 homolog n=1 Tax=Intoshia linei TaxID=1819745 RepID=A0A177BCV8_9BILA|nr:hypothetical protein A3Q56_00079 [Intoshia linei]